MQACLACTNQKIKCAPRAKWAEKRQKAGKVALTDQQRAAQQAEKEAPNLKAAKQTPETLLAGPSKQKEIKRNIFGKCFFCSFFTGFTNISQMILTN